MEFALFYGTGEWILLHNLRDWHSNKSCWWCYSIRVNSPVKMERIPRRYLIAILHFLGFFHLSAIRINMSIAIVAMTSDRIVEDANGTQIYVSSASRKLQANWFHFSLWINQQDGEFEWSSKEQGMVLASFFYGYITTQFIGGYLSPIVGAGRLFGFCILLAGVLNMITPTVAYYGYWPLIIVRALVGAALVSPSLSSRRDDINVSRSLW